MTEVVIEVGPGAIRGPNDVPCEAVSIALECIDDDIALLDERPVSVQDVWHGVIRTAAGEDVDTVVAVCPTWWSPSRIERVRTAARMVAETVVIVARTPLLRQAVAPRRTVIVELAGDFVVVTHPGARAAVVPRHGGASTAAEAVGAAVGTAVAVLVDAPAGVDDGAVLAEAIADRLRPSGIAVTFTDEDLVRREASRSRSRQDGRVTAHPQPRHNRHRRATAVLAGVATAAAVGGGFAAHRGAMAVDEIPMTLLVQGRVGMVVPADWTVQQVTSGPGSARVQIASPSDSDVAVHLTQSTGMPDPGLEATADSLRAALNHETDGVFVDFNAGDRRAGRDAVTYRELRRQYVVAWAVLVDDTVRIAIGCQSAPGREHLVREVCDQAIRSAHAVR